MVISKNNTEKRKWRKPQEFLSVSQQQVKKALKSLEKKTEGAMPKISDVRREMLRLGLKSLAPSSISEIKTQLEDGGHIRCLLEVID